MSKEMQRYIKNRDRYNERAKKYFNEKYYPLNKDKLLQKSKEQRQLTNYIYIKKENTYTKPIINKSLIVSFD